MKKYVSEFIGTFVLVFIGCGTAMTVGCSPAYCPGYFITALAFGIAITIMAYCIGNKSGCHINPAVSLAVMLTGGMNKKEFVGYVIAQCFGSLSAIATLIIIFFFGRSIVADMTGAYGANGLAGVGGSAMMGLLLEIVMSFVFILVVLHVSGKKERYGRFSGIIIGVTLTIIHIIGIRYTGTSVNPARSFGPAMYIGGDALKCLWVFIIGPFAGGALAATVYKLVRKHHKE